MPSITKSEIIEKIKLKNPGLSERDVEEIVNGILNSISEHLASGGRVEFRNFGIFDLKTRKAGRARNPKTNETIAVAEKKQPYFKAGKLLKQRIDGSSNGKQ